MVQVFPQMQVVNTFGLIYFKHVRGMSVKMIWIILLSFERLVNQ